MKSFEVPIIYRSPLITAIKRKRKEADRLKRDFSPTSIPLGNVTFRLARHFGFCYGVENAIEIAFKTVEANPGRRIFLLSEMIHNPQVNNDLQAHGIQFLQDTNGKQRISFDELSAEDIVMVPAFGTTLAVEEMLRQKGIAVESYDTTCPFVEKVWNRGNVIAGENYTLVIHGKPGHEETRATFSHVSINGPAIIVRDMAQAIILGQFIRGERNGVEFKEEFAGQYSEGFDPGKDLQRIGVINQTTMLAADTQAIADHLREVMQLHFKPSSIAERFADTRDTLCYATNDNQAAVINMLEQPGNLAIVIGGYNSSNTSHLVELCEQRVPTYFITDESKILSRSEIMHYDLHKKQELLTKDWLPAQKPLNIYLTSGASCPDALVETVMLKVASFFVDDPLEEIRKAI
jgi:4-hydroxy-3-methylbut-2-enyl diphosphate reductase